MAGHRTRMGDTYAFNSLEGKPTGNKSLGWPRSIWEDRIRVARENRK